ncbi:hypothetical protein DDZ13_01125 [Coraliomargarita sinensis]|uniref:PEP-CTERM protein-sorting domain-containing protein n=1 Tax=Coraliomargarita sinensis TaxID=2174842 RepID=A0A317ZKG0_9BACT|nr:hypothetical protein [Coraliomargarita sinensis]PXA05502.1 hypothetical protein DDZ13_01125 [Coraliomargarita sinensis]
MKIKTGILALLLVSSSLLGQNINFTVEKGELFTASGNVFRNSDNSVDIRDNFTVWAGFAQGASLTNFETGLSNFNSTSDLEGLNTTLGSIAWTAVPQASGILAGVNDYGLNDKEGTVGDTPLLLITSSSSFDNLTSGDQVGLVGSTTTVVELATLTVNFNGGNSWDTEYLGSLGSLTLQAVPEPSAFALIAGCFGLAWVMVRRRS